MQAGLGVALWLLARLGRTKLALPGLVTAGAICWNLGVAAGVARNPVGRQHRLRDSGDAALRRTAVVAGIPDDRLVGRAHFPSPARARNSIVSQWFLFAALFWFPWIYSTANLLLLTIRVRGIAQAVIAWWYSDNLLVVWLGLVGLAAVFYFVPKLSSRDLHSRYLALLAFWMLILFGSWGGIPASAPVPAWMPASSAVATGVGLITIIAVGLNVHRTLGGKCSRLMAHPSLRFIGFGVGAFIVAGLDERGGRAVRGQSRHRVHLVHGRPGTAQLLRVLRDGDVRGGVLHRAAARGNAVSVGQTGARAFLGSGGRRPVVCGAAGSGWHRAGAQPAATGHSLHRYCAGHTALSAGEHHG